MVDSAMKVACFFQKFTDSNTIISYRSAYKGADKLALCHQPARSFGQSIGGILKWENGQ